MKTNGNDKNLESYKIFPYVAWALTFTFALFVYNITMELKAVAENLEAQTKWLQEKTETAADSNTDFDSKPTRTQ